MTRPLGSPAWAKFTVNSYLLRTTVHTNARAGFDTNANVDAVNHSMGIPTGEPGAISAEQVEYLLAAWPHGRVLEANALEVYALHVVGQLSRTLMAEWLSDMPGRAAFEVGEGTVQSTENQLAALHSLGLLTRAELDLGHL